MLDSAREDFIETNICVTGELTRYNSTVVRQMWSVESYDAFNEPSAIFEFPTTVVRPGLWAVHTPLGGNLLCYLPSAIYIFIMGFSMSELPQSGQH